MIRCAISNICSDKSNLSFNSLPDDKILNYSKLKACADNKIHVTQKIEVCYGMSRKYCGKRRKCWLPAISPFPTMFSKAFVHRVVKDWHCVINGSSDNTIFCHCHCHSSLFIFQPAFMPMRMVLLS